MNKTIWVPCAYKGFSTLISPCTIQTRQGMIFCRVCMSILKAFDLQKFRKDFRPRLTYDEAMRSPKHKKAIEHACEIITFRKAQMALFTPISTNVGLSQKREKER